MIRWLYILPHLLLEAGAARRDARVRFLWAQVEILRRKLGGNRVTGPPKEGRTSKYVGRVRCQRFLGGLLRHYYRAA